ncbi:unnamed protein product [Tenebrio molitor]|nr:unnamed protein product [Tenebrio molitor]
MRSEPIQYILVLMSDRWFLRRTKFNCLQDNLHDIFSIIEMKHLLGRLGDFEKVQELERPLFTRELLKNVSSRSRK